jgi:hypothetical protein
MSYVIGFTVGVLFILWIAMGIEWRGMKKKEEEKKEPTL